jgi:hypothetical protein
MTNAFDCWLTDFGGNSLLSLPKRDITVQITTWDDAIEALSAEICNQIPEALRSILIHKFTTTTQNMHQAHTFTVTNAYREFVCVTFETLCGISNILLDGTEADWRSLKDIANAMLTVSQGKLAPWINSLQSALDLMIASFTEITPTMKDMWCRFISHGTLYKKNATSGWINVFFPYVYRAHFLAYTTEYKLEQNHMVWEWGWDVIHNPPYECDGIEYSKFPTTAMRQKFPLRNILDGTTSTIEVTAGLVATIQWPDGALESFLSYQVVMSSE